MINVNKNMDNSELKNALKHLLVELLEDETDFKNKSANDMYTLGQLSATQYNSVKIENILELFGSSRTSTIDVKS